MAMTRDEAAEYANEQFAELLADAKLSTEASGGLKAPIDQALRLLGLPLSGPVPDTAERSFLYVLDWTVLTRLERAIAHRVDISVDGPSQSKHYSQAVAQVRALRAEAWERARPCMDATDPAGDDWDIGYLHLNNIVAAPRRGLA